MVMAVAVGLAFVILSVGVVVSSLYFQDRRKKSPYECGFSPMSGAREPFSLRFFLIALLFLVFEAEAALFWPLISGVWGGYEAEGVLYGGMALVILFSGLLWEWRTGCLEWARD
uniref:NADH dehydrogenase subunit 3 n=1 Tax=Lima vulgaris TaxID=2671060 RepID=UPI0028FCA66B|nr:NADH dehydrogenase subunit 3 [Lima vulgaris]WNB40316.1 NADH dehydrogenase subunit 3 [Lima vulgaris]